MLTLYFLILLPEQIPQHSNIGFPSWLDQTVGKIFTTPNMHKIHHHMDQEHTDANDADIFIVWDRLFGTLRYVPFQDIPYGLADFDDERKQSSWYLLKSPFLKIDRISKIDPVAGKVIRKNPFAKNGIHPQKVNGFWQKKQDKGPGNG